MDTSEFKHYTVMKNEAVEGLSPKDGLIYIDGTLGGGGHSELIAQKILPTGQLISFDIDDVAIEYAYCGIPKGAPDTIPYIEDVEQIMHDIGLELPDISLLSGYVDPEDWWGDTFDGRYLSIILNQDK